MKYTIITGASSGIGKELAYKYAKEGHHLILIARRINILYQIKDELEALYEVSIECFICDLNDTETITQTIENINTHFEINCLINNAGISYFEKVEDLSLETIKNQINVNVIAPMLMTKLLIANLTRNNGAVINICSILSYLPNAHSSAYTTSKYALYGFSNSLRLDFPNLHVLTVHPITVKTNFFKDSNYYSNIKKVLYPNIVAKKIYSAYVKKKRKVNIPYSIGLLNIIYQIFPRLIDHINRQFFSNKK